MAEHKHAEVLRAIADGKTVQWANQNSEDWHDAAFKPFTPISNHDLDWRVKPEPFAWLDGKEFYEVCQQYRHARDGAFIENNASVSFQNLKNFIRLNVEKF